MSVGERSAPISLLHTQLELEAGVGIGLSTLCFSTTYAGCIQQLRSLLNYFLNGLVYCLPLLVY